MPHIRLIFATLAVAALVLVQGASASAQTEDEDYPPTTPTSEVLGEDEEPDDVDSDDVDSDDVAADADDDTGPQVLGATLPMTGGDVLGLTVFGLVAIGVGTVLVRRRRHT